MAGSPDLFNHLFGEKMKAIMKKRILFWGSMFVSPLAALALAVRGNLPGTRRREQAPG
jgi:hypothetical protein